MNARERIIGDREARKIMRMWRDGASTREICEATGRCAPTISYVANTVNRTGTYCSGRRKRSMDKIPFPGLRKWLIDNGVTIAEAADVCGVAYSSMRAYFYRRDPRDGHHSRCNIMPKYVIDRLIEWTGMTYEQLFYSPVRAKEIKAETPGRHKNASPSRMYSWEAPVSGQMDLFKEGDHG